MSNILSEVHPELVAEWSDKNLPLTPDRITYGSNKVVWWKGACGHEWQTSVKARSNGENCPICSGARVIEGINDLATLKPELADEWSSKNDPLKPTMVTTGSHKKVIWQDKYGQRDLVDEIDLNDCTPSHDQAIRMRKFFEEGKLTTEAISAIMSEEKPNQREKIVLRGDRVRSLIPKNIPINQTEEYVCKALEHYNKFLRNRAERDSR